MRKEFSILDEWGGEKQKLTGTDIYINMSGHITLIDTETTGIYKNISYIKAIINLQPGHSIVHTETIKNETPAEAPAEFDCPF